MKKYNKFLESKSTPLYTCLFVKNPSDLIIRFNPAYPNVYCHHSTIQFGNPDITKIEVGKTYKINAIGLARNDKADAILIENPKSNNKYPHITLSTAQGIKPVYSNELMKISILKDEIIMFDVAYPIDIIEGYVTSDGKEVK